MKNTKKRTVRTRNTTHTKAHKNHSLNTFQLIISHFMAEGQTYLMFGGALLLFILVLLGAFQFGQILGVLSEL